MKQNFIFLLITLLMGLNLSSVVTGQEEQTSLCAEHRNECTAQKTENLGLCQQDYDPSQCGDDPECVKSMNEERAACTNETNQIYSDCVSECQE